MNLKCLVFQRFILSLTVISLLAACQSKPKKIEYNPAFDAYLSAFTNGEVSKKATVLIRFGEDLVKNINEPVPAGLVKISPVLPGQAVWKDERTIEFVPSKDMKSGQIYTASVNMRKLFSKIPSNLSTFAFQFKAKDQFINVSPMASDVFGSGESKYCRLRGTLTTNDVERYEVLENIVRVLHGNKPLRLIWEHKNAHEHQFVIDSVARGKNPYAVKVTWDGTKIQSKTKGTFTFDIPTISEFKFSNHFRYNTPEQHLVLEFSDALDPNQDLEGLIRIADKPLKYSIENNIIKIYPVQKLLGAYTLTIAADIKSQSGKTLNSPTKEKVTFSDAVPSVVILGNGNIIPRSQKMPIVFKTINLNSVDVRVIKIKEDNVQQFFQVNQIEGNTEMKRVGKVVLQKKIDLDKTAGLDLGDWTHHSLELAGLIEPEAGAIYEIAIGFRHSYTLNDCEAEEGETPEDKKDNDMLALPGWDKPTYEASYWDWYGNDYNYEERDNPCKPFFYTADRVARRNILASDLGIMAKKGDNGNLYVVNNIQTTEPMSGVVLEFYDFQQDLITTVKTDKEGMAKTDFDKTAYLLIAKSGKQRGYLRLDDASALSMSRFDIAGTSIQKGLKGFIYGERGVWRPGDELFLNFILEDKDKTLPINHPVSFELKDPRGTVVQRLSTTTSVGGIYNFNCKTDEKAATGNYTAIVRVGGATFSKSLKVETIKPNRLKMALDFGGKEIDAAQGNVDGMINAKWMHGAIGKNLKAKIEMSMKDANTAFKTFPNFNFNDPATSVDSDNRIVFDGKLNENGDAKFTVKLPKDLYAAGMVNANFRTQVFEPGGDFSIDQTSVTVHPYKTYVGVRLPAGDAQRNMLLTDIKHKVEIATVDKNGKAVSKNNLEVKVYKLDWRWWFDQNKGQVSSYRGRVNSEVVSEGKISTGVNGIGYYEMEVKYPDWGRFLVRTCDGDGHCSGQVFYIDWPGWAGKSKEGDPEGATALNITADKDKYNVGDDVTLNIPTGFAGRALVTIESGSRILEAKWLTAAQGNTQYKFKTTKAMAPNVYAYVTLLQPHAQTKNDLPIRMYGILPIMVEDPATKMMPLVSMPDELKPMQDFTVTVAENKNRPMAYTVAIVDEGLLDLTKFQTPSPWDNFYQKEALGVKTWDMYNSVLGAFGAEIKSMLSIGGDGSLLNANNKKNDRFKPVVLTAGPFYIPAGKTGTHKFKMPNYLGSVRVMVVAADAGAYGSVSKSVSVRQSLMAIASLPRVLGPGETFKLPVTVFAMKEGITSATVTINSNEYLEILGGNTRSVAFKGIGEEMAYFEVRVKERAGTGSVKIAVTGGGHNAEYETDVEVRVANPRITVVYAASVNAGKTWEQGYKPLGIIGKNSGIFEVSAVPPLNLGRRLNYLIQYPYGCVEQTTSGAFPQLYLARLMELSDKNKSKIDDNVKAAIRRLQSFQNSSGGMGYWPGDNQANEWATNYAGHFLIEADKAGYTVPKEFLKKWTEFQKSKSNAWSSSGNAQDDLTQAYRLYLLALSGKPEIGAMNRMRLKSIHKDALAARWHLAAAYQVIGQKDVAKELLGNAATDVIEYAKGSGAITFGTQLRDQAMILQTLSLLDQRSKADGLLKIISNRLSGEQWLSTQETAQALVAMAKYVGEGGVGKSLDFEYRISGGSWQKVKSPKAIWQLDLNGEASTKVELRNNSGQIMFARVVAEGIPAAGNETDASNGLAISVAYQTLDGKTLDVSRLQQGEEFLAAVTVRNSGAYAYNEVALNQVFPSGWEVINHRLMGIKLNGDLPEYQDIRDDRVYSFFDISAGKSKTYFVRLNATYLGRYYLPAVSVEAMYDKSLNARKKGQWVEVIAAVNK